MKQVKAYYKACEGIKDLFVKTYFEGEEEVWWIGDNIGGVLGVSDFFFGIDDMMTLLENKVSFDDMMTWYHWSVDNHGKDGYMNLQNYLKSNLNKSNE